MSIADDFAAYLRKQGYDPRSSRHSDFQSDLIIRDLVASCPLIARRATTGELVAKLRHHQMIGQDDWVIDIALGTCAGIPVPPPAGAIITTASPVLIQIAIELKGVLTEHGKARRNRLRDFNAFEGHGHRYDPRTVVAAFLVVNSSDYFYSPLNFDDVAEAKAALEAALPHVEWANAHGDPCEEPVRLVRSVLTSISARASKRKKPRTEITMHTTRRLDARARARELIGLFRSIHLRYSETDQPGLEALGVIVVEHDNLNVYPDPAKYAHLHKETRVAPCPPGLQQGDPLSYESMIQRICAHYTQRFK